MKKLILAAIAVTCAVSVFAQGTVQFNNRTAVGTSHVWGPSATNPGLTLKGAASNDTPTGTTPYAASGMSLIGVTLANGQTTFAQILAATGLDQAESSLLPASAITTFRTGTGAGFLAVATASLSNVAKDAASATLQLVAWDNSSGKYATWETAGPAWAAGLIAGGKGAPVNVLLIGGDVNTPPAWNPGSFNLYIVPEPTTFALAGLGLAAMLVFRRRS